MKDSDGSGEVTLEVNGEEITFNGTRSIRALLDEYQLKSSRVAVEVNKTIVRKIDFDTTYLSPGDRVEIVTFVGGG